jgi:exopolysaccharide biosynthesis polyprenyl glycosylphosphotransferase
VKPVVHEGRRWRLETGERRLLLIFGDFAAALAATFIALALWAQLDWLGFSLEFLVARANWFIYLPPVWLLLMVNLYDVWLASSWRATLRGVVLAAAGGAIIYLVVYLLSEPFSLPRRGPLYFLFLVIVLTLLWRRLYIRVFTAPAFMRRVLIVGAGESGKTMLGYINEINPPPFHVVGLVDDDKSKHGEEIHGQEVLGDNSDVLTLIEEQKITDLIVAILGPMNGEMFQALLDAQEFGVQITRMPVAYEELMGRVPIHHLESDWLLRSFVDEMRAPAYYNFLQRLMDILGGLAGILICVLVYPWVGLALLIESGRPVLFRQQRLGRGGHSFEVVKFRTMQQDAEADGQAQWAKEGDPRTTRVGRFLRKTHLDEMPQFLNVLRGDMSIVGPRPERPELVAELEKKIPFYRARLLVKPGITGWAQVNYGKGASVEGSSEKLEYDLYYIKHRNMLMDMWIILRTAGSVLGLRGV